MRKFALPALAAFVAVASLAGPALAAGSLSSVSETSGDSYNETIVLQSLQARGIDASALSDWNGVIRATVRLGDGSTSFQYFDIDTLQPVTATGAVLGDTQVLSDRDVGVRTAPVLSGLTNEEPDFDT